MDKLDLRPDTLEFIEGDIPEPPTSNHYTNHNEDNLSENEADGPRLRFGGNIINNILKPIRNLSGASSTPVSSSVPSHFFNIDEEES